MPIQPVSGEIKSQEINDNFSYLDSKVEDIPTDVSSLKYTMKRSAQFNPVIVAYGDSNTRYYEGDRSTVGSISYAYSTWIERLSVEYPNYYNSLIINAGYPGETIEYGLANYATNVTSNNANIVVIGFGTIDIKQTNADMGIYLRNMEQMIDRLLSDGIIPIILGIPWYSSDYAPGTESRIPIWNESLMKLCVDKNVEFVDVYKMFLGSFSSIWFNEVTTPKRHYSSRAQKVLAEEIFNRILRLSVLPISKGNINQSLFDANSTSWFVSKGTSVTYENFGNGLDIFQTIKIPSGQSITISLVGRYVISFYPRVNATARFSNLGDISITTEISDGLYYPIKKVADAASNKIGTTTTGMSITAVGGDLYIRGINAENRQ